MSYKKGDTSKMSRIDTMVKFVKDTCNDPKVGYSQVNRWLNPDVDCSSFMYLAANKAGYNIKTGSGYTGSMLADFKKAGFNAVKFDGNLNDLTAGDIMLNVQNHTEMYIGGGKFGGAHIDENGGITGKQKGDQTGSEVSIVNAYVYSSGWDYVLVPPRETNKPVTTKSVEDVARDVIAGKYGNGSERTQKLVSAGYNASDVQAEVNKILAAPNKVSKDIDAVAKDVIAGKYGNGDARKQALEKAGYNYQTVQDRVNQLL